MDLTVENCDNALREMARLIREETFNPWEGELKAGVDLGTANIVLAVVDRENNPVAGAVYRSTVVRDGIVVDYMGAIRAVTFLKNKLESMLGVTLVNAATAIPPGILEGNVKSIVNVVEAAGFEVTNVIDEPTAASAVLCVEHGAVVDVGGGTTGISIIENKLPIYTNDEPTGGTHMTLVLAGAYNITTDEAEEIKKDVSREREVFSVVKPVVEKMASIVSKYIQGYDVEKVYVVGGACSFTQFEDVFYKNIHLPIEKSVEPLLTTPLGIAILCK